MITVEIAREQHSAVNVHSLVTPFAVIMRTGPIVVAKPVDTLFLLRCSDRDKNDPHRCYNHKKGKAELGLNVYPRNVGRTVLQGSKHFMEETFTSGT